MCSLFFTESAGVVTTFSSVDVDQQQSYDLDQSSYSLNGSEVSNKTLIVSSIDGHFLLQVFVKDNSDDTYEGFLGIPLELMLRADSQITVYEYVVATVCSSGGFCQFAVSALQDNTHVSIVFPGNLHEFSFCIGVSTFTAKGSTTLTMMKYQAAQFESTLDFTGTHIYSHNPIAVFAGSRKRILTDPSHTIEQLVPSTHWGNDVIATSTDSEVLVLKIVSNYPYTRVKLDFSDNETVITEKYQTIVRVLKPNSFLQIKANQSIQVRTL